LQALLAQKLDKKQRERVDSAWDGVINSYNEIVGYLNQMQFESKQK